MATATRPPELSAFCFIFLVIFGISSCGGDPGKAWEEQPDIIVTKAPKYPVASNFRPVLNDGFFFIVELRMEYSQPFLFVEGQNLGLVECSGYPGDYEVPDLINLYQERKEQEGGYADVVLAAHPEVPMKLIHFILRQFRMHGVFSFYFQVLPADGTEVEMALMYQDWGPYSKDQLEFLFENSPCSPSETTPLRSENSTKTGDSHPSFANQIPVGRDKVVNSGNGRILQLLEFPEENDILILASGKVSLDKDTLSLSALGNRLRRQQELSESPVRALVSVSDEARFERLILTMDQLIMSGLSSAVLVSEWEMNYLNSLRHSRQQTGDEQ